MCSRGELVRCGYLIKSPPDGKAKVAQWHRRWFVLADSRLVYPLADRYVRLEYFQNEVDPKKMADPKGVINLQTCVQIKSREAIKGHKHVFDVCTADRVYHLAAESAEEKLEWLTTLKDMLFTEAGLASRKKSRPTDLTGRWSPASQSDSSLLGEKSQRPRLPSRRPLSFTGESVYQDASSYGSPPNVSDHIRTRPLPPTPSAQLTASYSQADAVQVRRLPTSRPPVPLSPRPIRRVLPGLSRSTDNLSPSIASKPADISEHYEVGPGQKPLVHVSPGVRRKHKQVSPVPRPRIVHAHSTDADYSVLTGENEDYSVLKATRHPALDGSANNYGHLETVNANGSSRREKLFTPPLPLRKSRSTDRVYENVPTVPETPDGDYSHLTHHHH